MKLGFLLSYLRTWSSAHTLIYTEASYDTYMMIPKLITLKDI